MDVNHATADLDHDEEAYADANVRRLAVHTAHDIHNSLTHGDDDAEHCGHVSAGSPIASSKAGACE